MVPHEMRYPTQELDLVSEALSQTLLLQTDSVVPWKGTHQLDPVAEIGIQVVEPILPAPRLVHRSQSQLQ